jgi:anti-anti-sigma regulatory factor
MEYRFEFDAQNKILLSRFEGRLTDQSAAEFYEALRKRAAATKASLGIIDFSSTVEFAISSEMIRQLARQKPAPSAIGRPRVIVAPQTHAFGLFRMFQIEGEHTRPLLQVVRTMDEAFAALGVQSPHFEPLE